MATERKTTGSLCPGCGANQTGIYDYPRFKSGWGEFAIEHKNNCPSPEAEPVDCYEWDKLEAAGNRPKCLRPFGPRREGSPRCRSGSIASGGHREYCTCDTCF